MKLKRSLALILTLAMLIPLLLPSGGISIVANAATANQIETFVSSAIGFKAADYEKLKGYLETCEEKGWTTEDVPSLDRLKAAVAALGGADYYDDFQNIGTYLGQSATDLETGITYGIEPENAGEYFPTETNTTNYEVLYGGVKAQKYTAETLPDDTFRDGHTGTWPYVLNSELVDSQTGYQGNLGTHHVHVYWFEGCEYNRNYLHGEGGYYSWTNTYEDEMGLYNNWMALKDDVLNGTEEIPVFNLTINDKSSTPRIIYNYIDINNYNYLEIADGYTQLYEIEIKDGVKSRKQIGGSGNDLHAATNWGAEPYPAVTLNFTWNPLNDCYTLNIINAEDTSRVYTLDLVPTSHTASMVDNVRFSIRPDRGDAKFNVFNLYKNISFSTSVKKYLENRITTEAGDLTQLDRTDLSALQQLLTEIEAYGEDVVSQITNLKVLEDAIAEAERLQAIYESEFSLDELMTFEDGAELAWRDYFTSSSKVSIIDNPYPEDTYNTSSKVMQVPYHEAETAVFLNSLACNVYSATGKMAGNVTFKFIEDESYVMFNVSTQKGVIDADGKAIDTVQLEYSAHKDGEKVSGDYGMHDRFGMPNGVEFASKWIDFAIRRVNGNLELELGVWGTDGKYYCNTTVLSAANTTLNGRLTLRGDGYVDDLKVTGLDTEAYYSADAFMIANEYILGKHPYDRFLSKSDEPEYNTLVTTYQQLTDSAKQALGGTVINKTETAIAAFAEISPESAVIDAQAVADAENGYNNYEKLYEAFTNTENDDYLTQWQSEYANSGYAFIAESEELGRNVLRIRSNYTMALSTKYIPEQTNIKEISYNLKPTNNSMDPLLHYEEPHDKIADPTLVVYTYYKDENNYQYYRLYKTEAQVYTLTNGIQRGSRGFIYEEEGDGLFDPSNGVHVNIIYQPNRAKLTFTDSNGVVIQSEQNVSGDAKNIPAFGTWSTEGIRLYNHADYFCDIWDIKIKLGKGDWDEDVVQSDLRVSYTGNTYQAPGDVAVIRGENLGALVSSAKIYQVADLSGAALGYVDRTSYDYAGVESGEFTLDPSSPTWSYTDCVDLEIFRKSTDSIQFIIPEEFSHGIYAVQLNAVVAGVAKSRIVYLNAPVIDFYLGSDGEIASPGTELELVGENLAPNQNTNTESVAYELRTKDRDLEDVHVMLVSRDDPSQRYELEITDITSDYNIVVKIPTDIEVAADGSTTDWEVYVYNGYGDDTCWSIPTVIKIGRPLSELRPSYSVNILDYGITGTYHEDATAAMQQALTDLDSMGGGTLYIPEGSYRLSYTIYVPENITIQGEGKALSNIIPTYINFVYNELPTTTGFIIGSNTTIDGVGIYLKRCHRVICTTGVAENVTINDVKFYTSYTSWANNSLGQGGNLVDRHELYKYNESTSEDNAFVWGAYVNLKFTDILAEMNVNGVSLMSSYTSICNYGKFEDITYDSGTDIGWLRALFNNGVWKNCSLARGTATQARGVYMYNCTFGPHPGYNREVWVADLAGDPNSRYQLLPDETGSIENSVYLAVVNTDVTSRQWMVDQHAQLYIVGGNGAGQTAEVVGMDVERNCLIIKEPFQVPINRNSIVTSRAPREDIYFVDCTFYEGNCPGGFFGGCADVVHDGDYMNFAYNQYYEARQGDQNWYCSMINSVWENTPYSLIAAYGMSKGYSYVFLEDNSNLDNAQLGFLIRNNRIDNMPIRNSAYVSGRQKDFIIDNNVFDGMEYIMTSTDRNAIPDGLTFYRNTGDELVGYTGGDISTRGANALGYTYITYLDEKGEAKDYLIGDVNMDGTISLKDVTMVHYEVAGVINLTDIQLVLADVNGDGEITAVDATYIRNYILSLISKFPATPEEEPDVSEGEDTEEGGDEFSPGYH